jgi:hypothetical protein
MPVVQGNLTTTERVKEILDLSSSDVADDDIIYSAINACSALITSYLKRGSLKYGSVTEQVNGTGHRYLLFPNFPIIAITSLHVDDLRTFGSNAEWTEDTDFLVEDANTGKATSLITDPFRKGVMNVKLVYTHGYPSFHIRSNLAAFSFVEDTVTKTATIAVGDYNASSFATAVNTALTAGGAGGGITYTVTYDATGETFTLTQAGGTDFECNWSTTAASKHIAKLLGFYTDAADTGAVTYTSDEPAAGVPTVIEEACRSLCAHWLRLSRERDWNVTRREERESQIQYTPDAIPAFIKMQIGGYVNHFPRVSL